MSLDRDTCQKNVLLAQDILMKLVKVTFTDYEEWIVVLYHNILACSNTMEEIYEKLKLVLQRVHNLRIVFKDMMARIQTDSIL